MEVGKLYRVKEKALSTDGLYYVQNRNIVGDHGWLWVCEKKVAGERSLHRCRSIATGERSQWFSQEMDLLEE